MSLGAGLFASTLVLSLVILYAVTKDRWRWKRIVFWATLGPLAAIVVVSIVGYLFLLWRDRPTPLRSFYGIALKSSEEDVRFMKGEPTAKELNGTRWIYQVIDAGSGREKAAYRVQFRDGKVRYVMYLPADYDYSKEYPFGLADGAGVAQLEQKLGKPAFVSESDDGRRLYSYADYNAFFALRKGVVEVYGMYDAVTGPLEFTK